jgi:hypothetical protein
MPVSSNLEIHCLRSALANTDFSGFASPRVTARPQFLLRLLLTAASAMLPGFSGFQLTYIKADLRLALPDGRKPLSSPSPAGLAGCARARQTLDTV